MCKSSLTKIKLNEMSNKKIAIDTSIYMYKYKQQGDLMEGIFNMITVLQKYNIEPIFIFDGKPPIEKQDKLLERYKNKEVAEIQFNKLSIEFNNLLTKDKNKNTLKQKIYINKLEKQIDYCKRNMIKLSYKDIIDVKHLISYMGENYYESYTEADGIIAKLAKEKKVWGCLSEDMDMFVYGCPKILRYFSILKEEVVIYDLNKILKSLNLTHDKFKEICILSGTDYNIKLEFNINLILKKYIEYNNNNNNNTFYEWFKIQHSVLDITKLNNILLLFDLNNIDLNQTNYVKGEKNYTKMVELLIKYDYIFI
jgi:flap endonuclease-1